MKKYLLGVLLLLVMFLSMNVVKADEKVKVYVMTKDGCGYCELAKESLAELKKEQPDLFDVVEIEVFDSNWSPNSTDVQKFWEAVYDHFDSLDSSKAGTPTFIIGDYAVAAALSKEDLLTQINAAKGKDDEAKKIAQEINVDLSQYGIEKTETKGNDALIIIGILIVLVGGFTGLIYLGKK